MVSYTKELVGRSGLDIVQHFNPPYSGLFSPVWHPIVCRTTLGSRDFHSPSNTLGQGKYVASDDSCMTLVSRENCRWKVCMRCLRPSHHAVNTGINTSNARTTRNASKGIKMTDWSLSSGGYIEVIMESEHRCGKWWSDCRVERIWELLQNLWTTPGSLKVNPQLPYNPPYHICRPWTTYLLHHHIFVPITWSLDQNQFPIIAHYPSFDVMTPSLWQSCKICPSQCMIDMLWFLTMFHHCFDPYSFIQLIRPLKKHRPPFLSSIHHNVFTPQASNQWSFDRSDGYPLPAFLTFTFWLFHYLLVICSRYQQEDSLACDLQPHSI